MTVFSLSSESEAFGSVSQAPDLPDGFTTTFTSHLIDANGIRQHAVVGGAGPAVLLVHGWPENWYAWRHLMPELAKRVHGGCRRSARHGTERQARGRIRLRDARQ